MKIGSFLQINGVSHNDLKPANIVVTMTEALDTQSPQHRLSSLVRVPNRPSYEARMSLSGQAWSGVTLKLLDFGLAAWVKHDRIISLDGKWWTCYGTFPFRRTDWMQIPAEEAKARRERRLEQKGSLSHDQSVDVFALAMTAIAVVAGRTIGSDRIDDKWETIPRVGSDDEVFRYIVSHSKDRCFDKSSHMVDCEPLKAAWSKLPRVVDTWCSVLKAAQGPENIDWKQHIAALEALDAAEFDPASPLSI
jgi:serine/threonine protein kinase